MRPIWLSRHQLALYAFRYLDLVSRKWRRARYVATLDHIRRSHRAGEWETIGQPEIRSGVPAQMFSPWTANPAVAARADVAPEQHPTLDARERFLVRIFLRRYVTWCARRGCYAAMEGAARLYGEC